MNQHRRMLQQRVHALTARPGRARRLRVERVRDERHERCEEDDVQHHHRDDPRHQHAIPAPVLHDDQERHHGEHPRPQEQRAGLPAPEGDLEDPRLLPRRDLRDERQVESVAEKRGLESEHRQREQNEDRDHAALGAPGLLRVAAQSAEHAEHARVEREEDGQVEGKTSERDEQTDDQADSGQRRWAPLPRCFGRAASFRTSKGTSPSRVRPERCRNRSALRRRPRPRP